MHIDRHFEMRIEKQMCCLRDKHQLVLEGCIKNIISQEEMDWSLFTGSVFEEPSCRLEYYLNICLPSYIKARSVGG